MTIKAACSASMVGLHEACQSVGSGVCSSAIVAGSSLILTPTMTTSMSENMVLSPDGECRTFDANANGFARAEAINAVYIKRLDDAIREGDPIRAVIRSTMINSNGQNTKMGKPSAKMQEELIRKAYKRAGIADIAGTALFEAHGTGTQAGDAVETEAIAQAFDGNGVYISAVCAEINHGSEN
jgi:acyl transferase domain-containing protein